MTKNPPVDNSEAPVSQVPETGPHIGLIPTPRGFVVRGVWLRHKDVSRTRDFAGPMPRWEAEDQFRIAVVEHLFSQG